MVRVALAFDANRFIFLALARIARLPDKIDSQEPTMRIELPISSRALLISTMVLIAWAMIAVTGATMWSQHVNQSLSLRADMAYRQAMLVAQLELASIDAESSSDRDPAALSHIAAQYIATIKEEAALLEDKQPEAELQAGELRAAHNLVQALDGNASGKLDRLHARQLARAIAAREFQEAAQARSAANAASIRTRNIVIAVACVMLLVPVGLMAVFRRQLLLPLRQLEIATRELAAGRSTDRLPPKGLIEIRALVACFNSMSAAVETRVAERTQDIERANAELAAVDGRRRLFLSKVSHELRTPVTAIRGEAEVSLRHGGRPDNMREALIHIEQNSVFLQRRLDDLLLLAKAADAGLPLRKASVDVVALARNACDLTAAYALTSSVEIVFCDATPTRTDHEGVSGDGDRLQQAVVAVIDNAIKFSPPGGTVRVAVEFATDAATLSVTDEGPGVHEPELLHIFDPYVQGKAGRSLGGTGLGLSLARWIVEAHDGTIAANNVGNEEIGTEGLCVTMRLPIAG